MRDITVSKSVRVFISYAQEALPSRHNAMVMTLAKRLSGDGVDVVIDQDELAPAEGWPLWMEHQIRDANYVLMVCTEAYRNRVVNEEKSGIGLGVRWEGNLIYNELYKAAAINRKFIPIVFDKANLDFIPAPMQGVTYYMMQQQYDLLYKRLVAALLVSTPSPDNKHEAELMPQQELTSELTNGKPQFILRDIYSYAEDLHYPPRNGPHYPKHLLKANAVALSFTIASGTSDLLRIQNVFVRVLEVDPYRRSTFPAYGLGGNGAEPIISWVEIKPQEGIYKVETERRTKVGAGFDPADYHIRVFCKQGYKYRLTVQVDWLDINNQNRSGHHEFENIITIEVPFVENWTSLAANAKYIRAFFEGDGQQVANEFKSLDSHPSYTILDPYPFSSQSTPLSDPNVLYVPSFRKSDAKKIIRHVGYSVGGSINQAPARRFMLIDSDIMLIESIVLQADIVEDKKRVQATAILFDALIQKYSK